MKLSSKVSELLIELVDIESIDHEHLTETNAGLLCQNLVKLYGNTTNQKSQDLIIQIIDQGDISFFSPRSELNVKDLGYSESFLTENVTTESNNFALDEDEFMDLLPINGYFH